VVRPAEASVLGVESDPKTEAPVAYHFSKLRPKRERLISYKRRVVNAEQVVRIQPLRPGSSL